MRTRVITWLVVLSLLYAGVCGALFVMQDRMVFPGAGHGDRGLPSMTPSARIEWLGDGDRRTRVMIVSPPAPKFVSVYFGGNGEDLTAAAWTVEQLVRHGGEAIGVEYPGYGASPGSPSVDTLFATADAAAAFARARAAAAGVPFVVVGSSLGSFCAVHVAANGAVDRLVLRAPPTAIAAVAKKSFWWLPLGLLLRHQFDSLALAARVQSPVLVVHGERDSIVPMPFGRELAAALRAQFVAVPGFGHNDLDLSPSGPVGNEIRAFLGSR